MSKKCYLEVYSKHNQLNDKRKVEYWNKYIELIEPLLSKMDKPISANVISGKIKELLPEFKDERYPLVYHSKVGEDYFVYNSQLCFKYFVPDTFLMPFKKGQEKFSYKEDFDPIDNIFSGCHLKYETTVREGLSLIEKRVKYLEDSDFKTGCNQIIEFLKTMPLDSILILDSGDIYIEDSPEYLLEEIETAKKMFEKMDNK